MLTDRAASPLAWTPGHRVQACRSGESAIAAEALMNNAGSSPINPTGFIALLASA